jgi:hypothetical protein
MYSCHVQAIVLDTVSISALTCSYSSKLTATDMHTTCVHCMMQQVTTSLLEAVSLWHARASTAAATATVSTTQLPPVLSAARNAAAAAALVRWYLSALTAACSSEKSKVFDAPAVEQIAKECTQLSACIEKWGRDGTAAAMQGSTQVRQ